MIGKLKGYIENVFEDSIILNVNDVGYKVFCSNRTISKIQNIKDKISLYIETIVKEDSITLFGFDDLLDQECYNVLCTVNGIGNKVAMKILSVLNYNEIIYALANKDQVIFNRVPGIGPKLALRIITELKDNYLIKKNNILIQNSVNNSETENISNKELINDAVKALESLGYQKNIVYNLVMTILKTRPDLTLESIITEALKKINNL